MTVPLFVKRLLVRTGTAGLLPGVRRLADGGTPYLRYYSDAVLAAPVTALTDPAAFPGPAGPGVLDLNQPAPRLDPPTPGRAADLAAPPPVWGLPELRQAVADDGRRRDGRGLDPAQEVFVTRGAAGAFAAALDAFVNPGDRVVLLDPCSPLFAVGAASRRARVRWVPTRLEDGAVRVEAAALAKAMRGAKLLAVADPGNPLGGPLDPDDRERIAALAQRHDVLLYADESFTRFGPSGGGLAGLPGAERRTLTAGSASAGYGLTGARVGWLAGPRHLVRPAALAATLAGPYVPTICQQLAVRALASADDATPGLRDEFAGRRRYAASQLRAMGMEVSAPDAGYFLWASVAATGLTGRVFADRLVKECGVRVGPGDVYGPSGGRAVRVSVAADDGRLREGLSRLAGFVAGLTGRPVVQSATLTAAAEPPPEAERVPTFSRV